MKIHKVTKLFILKQIFILILLASAMLQGPDLIGQQLEIEWDGSHEELIRLIEGDKVRFVIEGETAGVPDRITFRIKTEPEDTLIDVMTIVEEGYLRVEKEPIHPKDVVTKAYLLNFGISLVGIQGILNAGYGPLELLDAGIPKDSLYGKRYAGGILFYLDDQDVHPFKGLVAALPKWNGINDPDPLASWGCFGISIPGADGTAIGTGSQNTVDIEIGCTDGFIAADLCANLDYNGYDDWFLPSIDELNEMYLNIGKGASGTNQNIGGFMASSYVSSSEQSDAFVKGQNFNFGFQESIDKISTIPVRAIRSF